MAAALLGGERDSVVALALPAPRPRPRISFLLLDASPHIEHNPLTTAPCAFTTVHPVSPPPLDEGFPACFGRCDRTATILSTMLAGFRYRRAWAAIVRSLATTPPTLVAAHRLLARRTSRQSLPSGVATVTRRPAGSARRGHTIELPFACVARICVGDVFADPAQAPLGGSRSARCERPRADRAGPADCHAQPICAARAAYAAESVVLGDYPVSHSFAHRAVCIRRDHNLHAFRSHHRRPSLHLRAPDAQQFLCLRGVARGAEAPLAFHHAIGALAQVHHHAREISGIFDAPFRFIFVSPDARLVPRKAPPRSATTPGLAVAATRPLRPPARRNSATVCRDLYKLVAAWTISWITRSLLRHRFRCAARIEANRAARSSLPESRAMPTRMVGTTTGHRMPLVLR